MSAATLIQILKQNPNPFDDPDGQIHLRLAYLLMANIFLLGHETRKPVYPWMWCLADDMQSFLEFP